MKTIEVRLGSSSYLIYVGSGLLKQSGKMLREHGFTGKLAMITNDIVYDLLGGNLEKELSGAGFKPMVFPVPDGERYKSLTTAGKLYQKLTQSFAERTTPIVALGGGVIGDLSGFVAATYMRGVPLVHIPTTLLAQVDSSIGGKTAVNHGRLKNQIGVFYQPRLVIADTNTLKTLPSAELINGLAEVIKSAAVWDADFFTFLERNLDKIKALDDLVLEEMIYRTARIKAEVVAKDERDWGLRNILNFGHTVGHGIEASSNFEVAHGTAVALGMLAAARISNRLGLFNKAEMLRLTDLLHRAGLSTDIGKLTPNRIIHAMHHDKKISQGKMKFILPQTMGKVLVTDQVSPELLKKVLENWHEGA